MELHELEVGDGRACAVGGGHAVAGGDVGVRRMPVEASAAPGGEHDRVGADVDQLAGCREHACADHATLLDEQVGEHRVLVHAHRPAPHGGDERGLDRRTRGVAADVQDAGTGVRRLEAALEARVAAVERDAEADEVAHAGGPLVAEHAHGGGVARGPRPPRSCR